MHRIALIQGHPDPAGGHLDHALADAYAEGAAAAGHEVRRIAVAALDFPLLRNKQAFEHGPTPPALLEAQDAIARADHLVFVYPLWLGDMPALLKGFLEQTFRPGFAFDYLDGGKVRMNLKGKSARLVVTMGMPAVAYRWFYGAHSVKSFKRNILKFVGIKPVATSLYGMVEAVDDARRAGWLDEQRQHGREAA
jgi:putative NADPH-quinone reductase